MSQLVNFYGSLRTVTCAGWTSTSLHLSEYVLPRFTTTSLLMVCKPLTTMAPQFPVSIRSQIYVCIFQRPLLFAFADVPYSCGKQGFRSFNSRAKYTQATVILHIFIYTQLLPSHPPYHTLTAVLSIPAQLVQRAQSTLSALLALLTHSTPLDPAPPTPSTLLPPSPLTATNLALLERSPTAARNYFCTSHAL